MALDSRRSDNDRVGNRGWHVAQKQMRLSEELMGDASTKSMSPLVSKDIYKAMDSQHRTPFPAIFAQGAVLETVQALALADRYIRKVLN